MKFRFKVVTFICLFCLGLSSISYGAAKPYEGVTLNFAAYKFEDLDQYLKHAKDAADELGIKLNIVYHTFDGLRDKLIADYRAKLDTWDVIFIDPKWVAEFADAGVNTPLQQFIDNPKLVDKKDLALDDFFEAGLATGRWKGKIQSLLVNLSLVAMGYRTDIISDPQEKKNFRGKYGYELGRPITYQQFMDISEFFTRKKGDTLAGKVLESDFYGTCHSDKPGGFLWHDYISYMVGFGADIYDPKRMVPTWNSAANIAAGEYYVKLGKYEPPGHINMTSGEATTWFAQGRLAMQIEFLHRLVYVAGDPKISKIIGQFAYDVVPNWKGAPKDRDGSSLLSGGTVGIYALSKKKEAAYKFIEKSMSPTYQRKITEQEPGFLPIRKSICTDKKLQERLPYLKVGERYATDKHLNLFLHPQLPVYPELMDIGSRALARAMVGEKPVRDAYNQAQKEMEEVFRSAGYMK